MLLHVALHFKPNAIAPSSNAILTSFHVFIWPEQDGQVLGSPGLLEEVGEVFGGGHGRLRPRRHHDGPSRDGCLAPETERRLEVVDELELALVAGGPVRSHRGRPCRILCHLELFQSSLQVLF